MLIKTTHGPRRSTWLGRAGDQTDFRLGAPMGARISAIRWVDTGLIDLSVIRGDGRTRNFITYAKHASLKLTDAELAVFAEELAQLHFA